MLITQISKYGYWVERKDATVKQSRSFSDGENGDYKRWLKEQPCALCGKQLCEAHHEPPIGNSGKDHARYWKCAVSLCVNCHRDYHDKRLSKRIRMQLQAEARVHCPRRFVKQLFNTIGKGG